MNTMADSEKRKDRHGGDSSGRGAKRSKVRLDLDCISYLAFLHSLHREAET